MTEEKINDSGFIPQLQEKLFEGRYVYFKRSKLMMGIFQGVGISQKILEEQTKYPEVLIHFIGSNQNDKKFTGLYLAQIEQFRQSQKKFANAYNDVQRFVSFADMKKLTD